ncbi:MAG TPA: hypothetical protein VF331_26325 [Polyangiales bacterium]
MLAAHTIEAPHFVPQLPQFFGSLAVLVQTPEHCVWPAGHRVHAPAMQTAPHFVPQLPQLFGSSSVLVQRPEQNVWAAGQTHALAAQERPPEQAVPQEPQWLGSLVRSRQFPEQLLSPA